MSNGIQAKIFFGCIEDGEIKMYLKHSGEWKEAQLEINQAVIETDFQDKRYIGRFIPSSSSYEELKVIEKELKSQLQQYCPKLNIEQHHFYLFPLIFIS